MIDSYLLCGTPRTGSTLLCALLDSTGVAGHPESYFRLPPDDTVSYGTYVETALAAGRTANGVFGARIMWGTMDEVTSGLKTVYPEADGGVAGLLSRAFGETRYVYLRRDDVLRQAVSLLRAEQTGFWHDTGEPETAAPEGEARYDAGAISERVREIGEHNEAWRDWFAAAGIRPYAVRYEDLDADPAGVAAGVLGFLGLDLPPGRSLTARNRRLADGLTDEWLERYRRGGQYRLTGR